MKCVILLCALVAVASAQLQRGPQLQRGQEPIPIVRSNSDVSPDGSFFYDFETANGIKAEARGQPAAAGPEGPAVTVQGSFSYPGDDGQAYAITYIADENGYQPQGAHLPVPPPIPEAILRSLEFNARTYRGEDEQPQQAQPLRPNPGRPFGRF